MSTEIMEYDYKQRAYDGKWEILGKVPITELQTTIKSLSSGVHAVVFDGSIDRDLVKTAERANINFLVGMDIKELIEILNSQQF